MKNKLITSAVILVLCAAAYIAASTSDKGTGTFITPVYAAAEVSAKESIIEGRSVGDVLVNGQVAFRIRTAAGGLSPYERAQVVAGRLGQSLTDEVSAEDISFGRRNGQSVVLANNRPVITVDTGHARMNNTTTLALADIWSRRLGNAVSGRAVTATPVGQKVVPIISVGSGTRVGGALVAGASDRLDDVRAVAQIEGTFGNAVRVRALVPVSTEDVVRNISRVPETSVIGLVDIKL
ncbi:MAG: hypothetical protein ACYC27_06860 [Armatimonadota bacterium]